MRIQNENLKKLAAATPGTIEFKKQKAAAIAAAKKRKEIEACYRAYVPLQNRGTVGK